MPRSACHGRSCRTPPTACRSCPTGTGPTRRSPTSSPVWQLRRIEPDRTFGSGRAGGPAATLGRTMTTPSRRRTRAAPPDAATTPDAAELPLGSGTWVVLPTYNEADNIRSISAAILDALPGATLLVVDDGSPDGTGTIADELSAADPRIRVRHRSAKQGLGRAYLDGFGVALGGGAEVVVQMDADWSHDPTTLPELIRPIADDGADLVIGSRYTPGGGVVDWGIGRRVISRGGSIF